MLSSEYKSFCKKAGLTPRPERTRSMTGPTVEKAKAEPHPEDDEIWDTLDGKYDDARAMATLAKMVLEGRLK